MNIFLTKRAEKNYRSIQIYITKEFGKIVSDIFEQKVIDFLQLIKNFPQVGSVEVAEKQILGFQITKQTRIFYRIKKDQIIILAFFDVRQNPKKKPQ